MPLRSYLHDDKTTLTGYQSNQTPTASDDRQTGDMFPTKMKLSPQSTLNKDEMSLESKTDPNIRSIQ